MMAKSPKALSGPSRSEESISIRKIDNGYIVSRSNYSEKKGYSTSETFLPKKPVINVPKAAPRKPVKR